MDRLPDMTCHRNRIGYAIGPPALIAGFPSYKGKHRRRRTRSNSIAGLRLTLSNLPSHLHND